MIRLVCLLIVSLALISCQSSAGALGPLIATITPTPEPTATATPTPTPEPTATITPTPIPDVIATALFSSNLRQGPGTDFARVGGVAIGEQFIVIGKNDLGDWWQLAGLEDEPVWISADLVEIQGPVEFVVIVP